MRVCVCVQVSLCYLSRGPLPFLVVPPIISSSCQCMYFLDRPWQPPLRTRATSNGWCNKSNRWEEDRQQLMWNCGLVDTDARPYLSWVLIGCSEGAVGVSGVQTGPVHVAVYDIRLLQHVLEAFHRKVDLPQVLQELLGVEVGPLQRVFTSVDLNKAVYYTNALCFQVFCFLAFAL